MTFENFVRDYLYNNGMFEKDVEKVIDLAKQDEVLVDTMQGRWQDDMEGYPPFTQSLLVMTVNAVAVRYIDANQPKAWYRAVFATE